MKPQNILLTVLFSLLPLISAAKEYSCVWQESSEHASGFFRQGVEFNFKLNTLEFVILKDDFLKRSYEPCWVGDFSYCEYSFTYNRENPWSFDNHAEREENEIVVLNSWAYGIVELKLTFKDNGKTLYLSGDDSDGTFFSNEKFKCE